MSSHSDPQRYAAVKDLFSEVCDLPEGERLPHLNALTDDAALVAEVMTLLRASGPNTTAVMRPIAGMLHEQMPGELQVGDTLGAWKLTGELGHGGMGQVYLAARCDGLYAQVVAIKVLRGLPTPEAQQRLAAERAILAGLNHPHIARLYDGGSTPAGRPYLVIEYVDGLPLDRYCREHTLGTAEALHLIQKVADAVAYAHRRLVVHCDLKPSNVLVTAEGRPLLLDFGIARLLESDSNAPAASASSGSDGFTPHYASPEQQAGGPVSTATDIYGLGRLLQEVLGGPATQAPADRPLPRELAAVIARATAQDPEQRYPSANDFSADLQRYLDHQPLAAVPPTLTYRLRKLVRRRWPVIAMSAALLVVIGVAGTRVVIERNHAQHRFAQLRKLAHSLVFDYHDAIAPLNGALPVRKRMIAEGLAYLDALAADAADDPELQNELAGAYYRIASIQGGFRESNIGEAGAARQSFDKAVALYRALYNAKPSEAARADNLSRTLIERAGLALDGADPKGAVAILDEAVELAERARTDDPKLRGSLRRALGDALDFRATVKAYFLADFDGAERDFTNGHQVLRETTAELKSPLDRARSEAKLYVHRAAFEDRRGRSEAAQEGFLKAAALLEGVLPTYGDHQPLRDQLGECLSRLGKARIQLGQDEAAMQALRRAREVLAPALAAQPGDAELQRKSLFTGHQIVVLLLKQQQWEAARREAEPLVEQAGRLAAQAAGSSKYQLVASYPEQDLADAFAGLQQWDAAARHATVVLSRTAPFIATDAMSARTWASAQITLGRSLAARQRHDAALAALGEAQALLDKPLTAGDATWAARKVSTGLQIELARVHAAAANGKGAAEHQAASRAAYARAEQWLADPKIPAQDTEATAWRNEAKAALKP